MVHKLAMLAPMRLFAKRVALSDVIEIAVDPVATAVMLHSF